ncbi:MAG: (deoxy)nucleoside triphosphate pyrophosphohydrolase [Elusimicrobia bacterium]|nr:(deoxy)nucleoside triphosphate pyrophosphohydrolase [Elusimicrobiota bacterium]
MTLVAAALLWRENSVLIGKRPSGKSYADCWEFPGGKIEQNETPEACVARELMEELGIGVNVGLLAAENTFVYPTGPVRILLFHARQTSGAIEKKEHADLRWVAPEKLTDYPMLPGNLALLPQILRNLQPPKNPK